MKIAQFTVLLVCVLACSCQTNQPVSPARRDLESAAVCCQGYEKFDFQALKLGDSESFIINTASPAFNFASGKSYFKAFRLPIQARSYFIVVNSYFTDKDNLSRSPYIFHPVVALLDAQYRVTRTIDQGIVNPIESGNSMNNASLEIEIRVNPQVVDERFMVIYTTPDFLNQVTNLLVSKNSMVGWIVTSYEVQNAAVGRLQAQLTSWRE
ncbi:MAG TPA: MalM family protein [Burkholderiales bacterium]|nr:MalM family protein [Burkholderiales bacterium]